MTRELGVVVGLVALSATMSAQAGFSVADQNEMTRTRCAVCHTSIRLR